MKSPRFIRWASSMAATLAAAAGLQLHATVLDNFDAATRAGWEDANPANLPFPGGKQSGGQFTFDLPSIGQAFFMSSKKVTETFELKEGRTLEYRVDMVSGRGGDSFAVLAFIPQATGPNTLAGYGIAKSETDVLITKGINKYFHNENPTTPIKNNNVTLVLNLRVEGGSVLVTGKVLDKDDGNRVLFEKTYVDTAAADVLREGTDSPAAPFINLPGNFVLYLYGDGGKDPAGYQVVYDNAETFVTDTVVLDDFNGPSKSGWEDKNPANLPLPPSVQADGRLTFAIPGIGQSYFTSARKTTTTYEIKEGTRHEFAVDLVNGRGGDSFAVLAWIPLATGANSLAGYGLAKSETDILVTKGINKYFSAETLSLKNNNVRLTLQLTVRGGVVEIVARVLDKDDGNQVIWERAFLDTPAKDPLVTGEDSPSAPFISAGNVVLYLYADGGADPAGYQVVYDNLAVSAPPVGANLPPTISAVAPIKGAKLLPASTRVSFQASDDKALPDAGLKVTVNGVAYTKANGLDVGAAGATRTVSLGGFEPDKNYSVELSVTDSDGEARTESLWFDTFTAGNRFVEAEDYNFDGGSFFNQPVRSAEGGGAIDNSYTDRLAVAGVDVNETRGGPNGADTMYRTQDAVRMQRTIDPVRADFNADLGVYDYDVGDLAAGEWLHYTRNFATGTYAVYLRQAVINLAQAESVLELVTGDRTQPNPTAKVLGSFLGNTTGYTYRNFPLTDGTGLNPVLVRLSGVATLRLRTVTADGGGGGRYLNYLVFVPVSNAGVQRAAIASLSPTPNETVQTVTPEINVSIENRDTTVNASSIKLSVGGADVAATVAATASGATVRYALPSLPPPGSNIAAAIRFQDNEGADVASSWSFTVTYLQLDPATRFQGKGVARGLNYKLVQPPPDGGALENSLARAEDQLNPNGPYPRAVDVSGVTEVVNYSQNASNGGGDGAFGNDLPFPGEDPNVGSDNHAAAFTTWLELPAGITRFGIISDDGYKLATAVNPGPSTLPLEFHNGGPADETFDVVVPEAGLYAFRLVWYERTGGAHVEWFTENRSTGARTLVNDAGGVRAWAAVEAVAPSIVLESATVLGGAFTAEAGASIDAAAKTVRAAIGAGDARFYRLKGATTIDSISIEGGNVVLRYR